MMRRTLAGLAAVVSVLGGAAIATAHPLHAAAASVDTLVFSPSDGAMGGSTPGNLAPPASLGAGAGVPLTVTALSGGVGGTPVAGEMVNLEFNHEDPTTGGGTASVGSTPIPSSGMAFTTDGSGKINISYHAPSPVQAKGRDVIFAQDASALTVTNTDVYDSSPVVSYAFTPSPIASPGALGSGQSVTVTVTAQDGGGHGVAGADILLSFVPTSGGGSASSGGRALHGPPHRFTADTNGNVSISYTAGSNISGGMDTIRADNHTTPPRLSGTDTYTYHAASPAIYHAVTPFRLFDTRSNGQHLTPGHSDTVAVVGVDGVPASATAAVLNVTSTGATASSFFTVYPGPSLPSPLTSNLNFVAGQTVANLVTTPLGGSGTVGVYNLAGTADAVVDLEGYFSPGAGNSTSGLLTSLPPTRIIDTRLSGQTLGGGSVLRVQVTGAGGVPSSNVSAVVLNVTATGPTASSYLTAYPDGASLPVASNLNFTAGEVVPNRVIVPVGTGGVVDVYNFSGRVDVVADVGGWFNSTATVASGKRFTPVQPTRVADTRTGSPIGQQATIGVSVAPAGPPSGATAVAANVTVADGTAPSYLTVFPGGTSRQTASDLNWTTGQVVPNLCITGLGSNVIDLYNNTGSVDAIVDVFGFWS